MKAEIGSSAVAELSPWNSRFGQVSALAGKQRKSTLCLDFAP